MKPLTLTVGGLARAAGVSEWTVRRYAKENLVPHGRDSAGRRLFEVAVVPAVKALYEKRIASRGSRTAS
jgi:DNA-binding transcriptional MerR regulator